MSSPDISECQAGCSHCSSGNPILADGGGGKLFTGWRLAVAALWVFALPLALAVTGAIVARWYWPEPTFALLATLAGLVAGGAISWTAVRFICIAPVDMENDGN